MSALFVIHLLVLFKFALINAGSCNYATFSVETLYPSISIGTFSLSTNRCQSLKATLKYENSFVGVGFNLPMDGSLKLSCESYSDNIYGLAVNLYSDALCNDLISFDLDSETDSTSSSDSIWIDMEHNTFTIYDSLRFSLDEMSCDPSLDATSCGISMEMANNCSWSKSERYINISVPDSHCVTLSPDFNGIMSFIPFQIVPTELVDRFETSSMEYTCCSSDNSLLISNYSNTKCLNEPDSQFRIPQIYNGQCFVIGNDEAIVEDDTLRGSSIDENAPDSYVYIMKWQCNSFQQDCDSMNIPKLDETYLPQMCSDECINSEAEQEANSNQGASGRHKRSSSEQQSDKIAVVVAVIGGIIALFMIIVVGFTVYGRQKSTQRQNEANIAVNMMDRNDGKNKKLVQGDDKYEAFVSQSDPQNMNIVQVESVEDTRDHTVQ